MHTLVLLIIPFFLALAIWLVLRLAREEEEECGYCRPGLDALADRLEPDRLGRP